MSDCSLASLAEALSPARGSATRAADLEAWLAGLPDEQARATLRRALVLDAPLVALSFASLGSCLYARALAVPSLAAVAAAWARELDARGGPWVQALRPVPLPVGLVAQRTPQELPPDLAAPQRLELPSGAALEISRTREPRYPHLAGKGPHPERLIWKWSPPSAAVASAASAASATRKQARFVKDGWGPVSLVRTPGAAPILLPCPDEGSADASFSEDGALLFVHGTHDEYAGGFAMLLDPETLAVRLSLETARPVSSVSVCTRPDRILLHTYGGLVLWTGGELRPLPLPAEAGRLSPDGEYLATGEAEVRVWSVDELLASGEGASEPGFITVFDPTGERLVSYRTLYHGRTGEVIAQLQPHFSNYLEGGPASPSFQCTERFIINMQSGLQLWDTSTGAELGAESADSGDDADADSDPDTDTDADSDADSDPDFYPATRDRSGLGMFFPQWFTLAYDVVGSTLAALRQDSTRVDLHSLPPDGTVRTLDFETAGHAIALDRDAARIALAGLSMLEVRERDGALVRRWSWRSEPAEQKAAFRPDLRLRFSRDGARLACSQRDTGWTVWALSGDRGDEVLAEGTQLASLPDFAEPALTDWQVEGASSSVLTHLPTGTRVGFPAPGAWIIHPFDARIAANHHAHVALRWATSTGSTPTQ